MLSRINNNSATETVTILPIQNTNCVICGAPFSKNRAGKLYCSTKCRQSAYYHKEQIIELRTSKSVGINREILTLSLKEYKKYHYYRDKIKEYRKLQSQFRHVEEGSGAWEMLYNSPNSALSYERKLIPKKIFDLNIPNLSIDQWSFIKSLYPEMGPVDLAEFVCFLSQDFIDQLNPEEFESNKRALYK